MRPRFFDLVLFLLLATALAFVTAPLFAFRALKSAATYEDVAAIAELVDFPATRRALTQQLEARATPAPATAEPPSLWRNPMGVFRRAIEPIAPPKPTVDRYLTVAGFSALTRGYAPGAAPPITEPTSWWGRLSAVMRGPHPTMVYWDPHRARIAVPRPEAKDMRTVFTWQRRDKWFEWKLVAMTLPAGEP